MGKQKGNRKSETSRDGGFGKTGMGRDILAVGLLALGTALAIADLVFWRAVLAPVAAPASARPKPEESAARGD